MMPLLRYSIHRIRKIHPPFHTRCICTAAPTSLSLFLLLPHRVSTVVVTWKQPPQYNNPRVWGKIPCIKIQCFSISSNNNETATTSSSSSSSSSSTSSKSSTTSLSDDEYQHRLSTFKDLYVVARDCMEDLLTHAQREEDNDAENMDDEYANDEFIQHVTFVQESVETALTEYERLFNFLQDHPEIQNQFVKNYGIKVKQLELEMAMLLKDVNEYDDDDDEHKTIKDDEEEDDDDDDWEIDDDEEEEDDENSGDNKK